MVGNQSPSVSNHKQEGHDKRGVVIGANSTPGTPDKRTYPKKMRPHNVWLRKPMGLNFASFTIGGP